MLAGPRSVTQVESSVLGPLEGFLMDKFGPRVLVTAGVFIMGLGFILFGLTHSLWMYFLSNIVVILGSGLQGGMIISVAINHWFRRKRATANAITMLGGPMFGLVGVPALILIQTTAGWRTATTLTGLIIWIIGLPLSMLLRGRPEPYGLLPDGDSPGAVSSAGARIRPAVQEFDFTLRQALHTRAFWSLVIGQAAARLGMQTVFIHVFLHLEKGVGLAALTAAFVWSIVGVVSFPSRLIGGIVGDRVPKNIIVGATQAMMGLSMFVLAIATSLPMAIAFAVIFGIGWGARNPVFNAIEGDYFGYKHQGVIRGWLSLSSMPFSVSGPIIAGYLADVSGTYRPAFIVMSFVALVGAAVLFLTSPPKHPVTTTASDHGG